ncbi:MAG: cupin domain-containing protein [Pseudomonadales bacterium]|nr:cupin domain-containing protein [Pseudomonadales bacterium]
MIKRHPDSDLLVEYVSGSLSTAPGISVTTHLQFCDKCTRTVESLEEIGGSYLDEVETMQVSDDLLDKVLACVDSDEPEPKPARETAVDDITGALPGYVRRLLPEGKLRWRFLSPSLKVAPISVGETTHELALHRIKAGGKAPQHNHNGREITVVLTGSFSDEDGVYHPGDFLVREPGDTHQPNAAQHEECICLSVLDAPIRLTGLKKVFTPFVRFSPS